MYAVFKRCCDIAVSGILLLILSPLLIPIMIGLKLTGEGYIWYFQERVGFKNRKFHIYKFATMLKDSPNMAGGIITTKKDPRITPMGGFLRKSKINELPQLINIFKGDMSVVGPRPVMAKSFAAYPEAVQEVIYNVPPGLTGIGSIIFRDEEELITKVKENGGDVWDFYTNQIYPYKGQVEQWYQSNRGFLTDLKIIFITAWVIVFPNSQLVYRAFKGLPERGLVLDKKEEAVEVM
ncbi:sugar transferase [Robertkochia flava]|uniref:sugar transferase n=1 Tax=Robertkochia flava TaxID=3447986 RepID=UPI001CCB116B|nr:sugar transferase [Robertkochia marina]